MVENEIKRHDIFLIVFGIILGFADPITDILTLVELYREDHKILRASISVDWLRTQSNIFAGGDPGIFHWGRGEGGKVQILVQKGLLNFFVANYFSPTPPPTSHWEGRDDYVFLNLWKPVAIGAGNTALRAEANRSLEGTQLQSHFLISLEFS